MAKVLVRKHNEDFTVQEVEGEKVGLEFMQSIVEGNIELVSWIPELAQHKIDMIINEEGKLRELPPTFLVEEKKTGKRLDLIMGNVLFCSFDDNGNSLGLDDLQIKVVKKVTSKLIGALEDGSIVGIIQI